MYVNNVDMFTSKEMDPPTDTIKYIDIKFTPKAKIDLDPSLTKSDPSPKKPEKLSWKNSKECEKKNSPMWKPIC